MSKLIGKLAIVAVVAGVFLGSALPAAAAGKKATPTPTPTPTSGWTSTTLPDGGWD